jgi:hypothetical protein
VLQGAGPLDRTKRLRQHGITPMGGGLRSIHGRVFPRAEANRQIAPDLPARRGECDPGEPRHGVIRAERRNALGAA